MGSRIVIIVFTLFFFFPLWTDVSLSTDKKTGISGETVKEQIIRQDAKVEFSVKPVYIKELLEGEVAEINFKITDSTTGTAITTLRPSVWVDLEKEIKGEKNRASLACKDKIGIYMQGSMGYRPDIDLNSYFILSLNNDSTISVTDPIMGISGITQLYSMIYLKQPGEDWVLSSDEKKLFVTMPKAGQVAVADTESFKVLKNIDSGIHPVRIVLQPDRKYLWVGNDSEAREKSGITVIDAEQLKLVSFIPTGTGHHEVTFTEDSHHAFVTNRSEGTLSILDVQKLNKVKDIKIGELPVAIAFSNLSQSVYVANEGDGNIVVLDGKRHEVITQIQTKPGLKTLRFAPGGRWGFTANLKENLVYIFDSSSNRIVHTVEVGKGPDQITFTKTYAYIRSKGSPDFTLIQFAHLGKEGPLPVLKIPGGQKSPGDSSHHAVADAIFPAPEEGHTLIANPADGMIYYYMEGMMASMGSFRSYGGHVPRAVRVVDRSLRETEKGIYSARIRIPASGKYQVAFLLDSPRIIHCFEFSAKPNPIIAKTTKQPTIEVLTDEKKIRVGENFRLKFKVITSPQKEPIHDIKDLIVQATLASGLWWERFPAKHLGDGIYEVNFVVPRPGVLFLNFTCPSLKVDFKGFPSLIYEATSITTMKFERELFSRTISKGGPFSKIL